MSTSQTQPVKVIFRTFHSGGEVIALFPEVPVDNQYGHCVSYAHVGQHGAASVDLSGYTRPSTPEEIAPLLRELEAIGYKVEVRKARTAKMDNARRKAMEL